jgi:hypothetical protein
MDRIRYAGGSLITGSAIAHAVLEYGKTLAQERVADTVRIPTIDENGRPGSAELLVGPASELVSISEESPHPEIEDEALIADLRERTSGAERGDAAGALDESELPRPVTGLDEF